MKKSTFLIPAIVAILSVAVISCKKTPAPTAEISATINGYTVDFSAKVTDVDTYSWNFGDGQTSTEASPSHTYTTSGNFIVTLVVKGGGGDATAQKTVSIAPSFLEMLTGGVAAANGKTWVLSATYYAGDGIGPIDTLMPITTQGADSLLKPYLKAEYDNEFTFFANGEYTMNPKNGYVLAGLVFGVDEVAMKDPDYDLGLCATPFTPPASATWTEHNDDLTLDAITDPSNIPPAHENVTFTGKKWISLSAGAFFGVLDYPTTAQFIIKEITPSKMSVALFLCEYSYDPAYKMFPSNLFQITFVPKAAK